MDAASRIRSAVDQVADLRQAQLGDPRLLEAIRWIKRWQNLRFARTYADLSAQAQTAQAVRFFLQELYSDADFSLRDQQFHRIAGTIGVLFPKKVGECAAALAELHGLTEGLDDRMARFLSTTTLKLGLELPEPSLNTNACVLYAQAWQCVGARDDRLHQLQSVVDIGRQLARFTVMPGLRSMLRMMRGPASAGGLSDLQRFLESGFDTFADLSRSRGGAEAFIQTIERREAECVNRLFEDDPAVAARWLVEAHAE